MADLFYSNLDALRQVSSADIFNLTEAYVGTLRRKFIWINNEGGQDDNNTVIIPSDNPPSGRWICPQSPMLPGQTLPWNQLDKTGSQLNDLTSRSATDLDSGTIHYLRLPAGVPYFDPKTPDLILTTDSNGDYQLSHIDYTKISGLIPFAKINWTSFDPSYINAESFIYFNPNQFDRDSENNISIKLMSINQAGLAVPGDGIATDNQARINVIYGTGPKQALEGPTPLGGDLSGEHSAAVVDALRNVPLTFFFNQLSDKDGYVLRLDSSNPNTPFFYLSPGGGGGLSIPDITGHTGALQTDGSSIFWAAIPTGPGITFSMSFNVSPSVVEIGQSVVHPSYTATYNETVTEVTISDQYNHTDSLLTPYTSFTSPYTFTHNTQTSETFTLTAKDPTNTVNHKTTQISWLPRIYWGTGIATSNYISLIQALQNSQLASNRGGSFTVTPGATEYIYYAIPSSFGSASFAVGGFSGGFTQVATVNFTNSYGVIISYDVYKSDNLNLGSTTVSVS